jgi:hypothetical protein
VPVRGHGTRRKKDKGIEVSRLVKFAAVLAGYFAALLAAFAAVYFRQLRTQADSVQASSGMYAFGESLVFLGVFGIAALLPTGLWLCFLRPFQKFWGAFSIASLALALTGPVAGYVMNLASTPPSSGHLGVMTGLLALLRMFGAPLLAVAFVISAAIAPTVRSRWTLIGAALIECGVSTPALLYWFASHGILR